VQKRVACEEVGIQTMCPEELVAKRDVLAAVRSGGVRLMSTSGVPEASVVVGTLVPTVRP
jgi:hypothetical protein